MSSFLDKAKDAMGKATGGSKGESGESGGSSGGSSKYEEYAHKGIDSATDRAGLGDKYDDKIDEFADSQIKKRTENQSK